MHAYHWFRNARFGGVTIVTVTETPRSDNAGGGSGDRPPGLRTIEVAHTRRGIAVWRGSRLSLTCATAPPVTAAPRYGIAGRGYGDTAPGCAEISARYERHGVRSARRPAMQCTAGSGPNRPNVESVGGSNRLGRPWGTPVRSRYPHTLSVHGIVVFGARDKHSLG